MATRSSVLAWEIPWTEEPGGLQSLGLQSQTRLNTHTQSSILYTVLSLPFHLNLNLCELWSSDGAASFYLMAV